MESGGRLNIDRACFCAAVLGMLAGGGCATTRFNVPRLKPAEVNLGPVKKVAIGTIQGDGGGDISDALTQAIMTSGRYEVVDRQHLDEVYREQSLGAAGEAGAAQVGKVLGAAALIFGRVTQNRYTETVNGQQNTCMRNNQSYPCTTYTRLGALKMSVNLKVVSAQSGKILATKTLLADFSKSTEARTDAQRITDPAWLANNVPPIDNPDEIKTVAINNIVAEFMKAIAPYTVSVEVLLFDLSDLPSTGRGVAAAKSGDWSNAISAFQEAVGQSNANPKFDDKVKGRCLFNLGVALGYSGQFDEGLDTISQAARLIPDEDAFPAEAARIRQYKVDDARLRKQQADSDQADKNDLAVPGR